ncbi:glycosyltransferase family 4 protein [Streptomyces radicis]|uniref:Glycosyltransferase n=1 Tax=Streptomyces radicis TaxID=1750517 RepID=A0A3A9VQI1_9ACTN|nr:glycosyltransferase family 4 protein [Streptomyces radicis]RKN03371.1 glycosyltransferase [Streptomyces radicis]RKN13228.1 glycosyltransferase [Streptomyces radicis]
MPVHDTPALLYCAVNGITNCTNGIGRQTKTLLAVLEHHYPRLATAVGDFTPYLAVPQPGPATWNNDPADLAYARSVVEPLGGQVIPLIYDTSGPLWLPETFEHLSTAAATAASDLARTHPRVIVVAVDTPFAGVPAAAAGDERVEAVLALFSTTRITERPTPDPGRLAWEQRAITAVNALPRAWVADIGAFLTGHLTQEYGLDPGRLVSWPSGLHLPAADLQPMPTARAAEVLARFGIPTGRPIIAHVGRTDPTKGLDLLIDAIGASATLRDRVHLAAIAVPTDDERATLLGTYRSRCRDLGLSATIVGAFDRDLPRALASWPGTHVMACPSRGETLANTVFETALWARDAGPVVLAPGRDGFTEQITDGHNGLLYHPTRPGALTTGLHRALTLTDAEHARMRAAAHHRVVGERDATAHLAALLGRFIRPGDGHAAKLTDHPSPDARPPRSQAPHHPLETTEATA